MSDRKRVKIPLHRLVESIAAYYRGMIVVEQEPDDTFGAHNYIAVALMQEVEVELDEEIAKDYSNLWGKAS